MSFQTTNFVIIKLTLYLIIGIALGDFIKLPLYLFISISVVLLIILGSLFALVKSKLYNYTWLGIIICISTISIGLLTVNIHNQRNFTNHYTKSNIILKDSSNTIQFRITNVLKPGYYHDKYEVKLLKLNDQNISGKSLLNIEKDTLATQFKVDEIVIIKTNFNPLNKPINPYQFDYKKYLKRKHIFHQLNTYYNRTLKINSDKHTIYGYAALIRENVNKHLKSYSFKKDELSIINALLLGQRQDISKDIYDSYTKAGAIHILAVSGLHVGIILMLLHNLLKPIEYLKQGRYIKIVIIVILLWSYAIIAGLSASVVRAVTMFTIFAIAMNLKRPTNVYNTLAISMFVLLLFKPSFLFDVGFQMSYLAVIAIVTIEPILRKLWYPKLKIVAFFWRILTVTFSAQIGVIPISLFYFHQFPGLFFVSNLVIIPCLGVILGFGIITILLALLNLLPNFIASLYGNIISLMNTFINWVSNQEGFLFQNISFSIGHVLLSYLLIISLIALSKSKTRRNLVVALLSILCFQSFLIYNKFQLSNNAFIIFHKSRFSIIAIKENRSLILSHNLKDSLIAKEHLIINYKVGENIIDIETKSLKNIYQLKNINLLVVDSLGVYNIKRHKPNLILLRNSPKINLVRLIDSVKPEIIISDGSNYKSYQERWSNTCKAKKIPFHQTSEKGAFILNY